MGWGGLEGWRGEGRPALLEGVGLKTGLCCVPISRSQCNSPPLLYSNWGLRVGRLLCVCLDHASVA